MSQIQLWTLVFVVVTFGVYIYIAYASRVSSTAGFYIASGGVPAPANGAAIAADWMSAASFISLAGIVAFSQNGYAGSVYLMGWTGGYVLLALLLAPYLRKFGKYTIPDFVGDRYSESARLVAVVAAIVISFVYVAGLLRLTNGRVDDESWRWRLDQMGQVPFHPPNVSGWDSGTAWLSTSAIRARFDAATAVLSDGSKIEGDYVNLGTALLRGATPQGTIDIPWDEIESIRFRR